MVVNSIFSTFFKMLSFYGRVNSCPSTNRTWRPETPMPVFFSLPTMRASLNHPFRLKLATPFSKSLFYKIQIRSFHLPIKAALETFIFYTGRSFKLPELYMF